MENLRRWINYDWFKLIVALILLVIFILLLLRAPAPNAVAGSGVSPTTAAAAATATNPAAPPPIAPATAQATEPAAAPPTASPTAPPPTATVPQPTATARPEATQAPSPTPTQPPTATAEAQQPAQATASGDCSKALATRLDVGKKAQVVYELNLRADPGMDKKVTFVNFPGARLDIIGGPVCIPYGSGMYRWWNVKMPNGTTGWSAEGSLAGKRYFMEPVP